MRLRPSNQTCRSAMDTELRAQVTRGRPSSATPRRRQLTSWKCLRAYWKTRDGEYGFSTFADPVETARAEGLPFSRAEGCRVVGEKLSRLTRQYGGEPANAGNDVRGEAPRMGGRQGCRRCRQRTVQLGVLRAQGKHTHCAPPRGPKDELPANVRAVVKRQAVGPADSRPNSRPCATTRARPTARSMQSTDRTNAVLGRSWKTNPSKTDRHDACQDNSGTNDAACEIALPKKHVREDGTDDDGRFAKGGYERKWCRLHGR